ncbi:MAG: sugar ABC transporter substrate-binding protein [Selenomonas ruminantium]|nr:sugar ABC transporter substrate-binding protein [Selenomonas ruminantium]
MALAGCGGSAGGGSGTVIYANYKDGDGFTDTLRDEFKAQASSTGWQVEYLDGKNDGNFQIDQLNEALEKKPSAIVLLPADSASIVPTVQKANEMGIPIVCVNRFPDGGEYSKSYSDDLEAGRMQGEFMAARLPQGAKVVYLKGASGNAAAEGRWEGFKKYCLDKRSDVKLLAFADANWSTAEAMKDMSLWLDMFPQIDGVICGNDGMAMGAIAALKGAGRLSGVLISGVDATGDALAAIKTGEMAQTVKQDAAGQAKGVFSLVQQSMQGQKPDNVLVPYTSITRENVSQFAK